MNDRAAELVDSFLVEFCKVDAVCHYGEPNWLGWIVIVIGGVMAFFLSMAIILGVIGAIFDR
jgi:hypothetical protein